MNENEFNAAFESLTGNPPLSWQRRLFLEHFANNDFPPVIDLPTGLGKTMVMAIWLIARAVNPKLPTRLIYVVDRRTVVDQATDLAQQLIARPFTKWMHDRFEHRFPTISTLRGQLADNREWSRDPSRPAIIIGTVDLIGSGLLFSGYRSSFKRRPLEAGLLGQDSLLVLDEAHLSKPFERLISCIADFQSGQGLPMKVIRMSATSGEQVAERVFRLNTDHAIATCDLIPDPHPLTKDERNIIVTRFGAKKAMKVDAGDNVTESIAAAANGLATLHVGSRIVIFVKSPKDVAEVRKALIKKDKTCEPKIAMLTGTMRGLERDELVTPPSKDNQYDRWVMQRFLRPDNDPSEGNCFLISTSAGEVGFDLNADHMVCDAAPLDSMIQRLGRVNRRGNGDATIHLILSKSPAEKSDLDKACSEATKLLTNGMDVSPKALVAFQSSLTSVQRKAASTPEPRMVDLTGILLDAWSMTSITTPMPGRPEVAPWLRGIADELPQTTIAWRAELDLPGFDQLDLETIEEWFDTHRVLTHETLSVPTSAAAKWFTDRWNKLTESQQQKVGALSAIVDRAGLKKVTVKELIDQLLRKSGDITATIRNADLIVPASFGGIERGKGLLDSEAPETAKVGCQPISPDVADERDRFREIITKPADGEPDPQAVGTGTRPKPSKASRLTIELESDDEKTVKLVSHVPKWEKPETGSARQTLAQHVQKVRDELTKSLSQLDLPEPLKQAAHLAAEYHDHGKNRERWQRTIRGTATIGTTDWLKQTKLEDGDNQTLGKSGDTMRLDPRGYRHEFGSLRELIDKYEEKKVSPEVLDLALHLIAVHHGRGRPHFPKGGFDPEAEHRSPAIHADSIRRFGRLQRKYGHWQLAWLENLLRCADALASVDSRNEMNTDVVASDGGAS